MKCTLLALYWLSVLYLTDLEGGLKDSEETSTTVKNDIKFSVWVSFFEIYNECFYDLLIPTANDKKRKTLRLAQDIKGCSYVKGDWNTLQIAKYVIWKVRLPVIMFLSRLENACVPCGTTNVCLEYERQQSTYIEVSVPFIAFSLYSWL